MPSRYETYCIQHPVPLSCLPTKTVDQVDQDLDPDTTVAAVAEHETAPIPPKGKSKPRKTRAGSANPNT